MVDWADLGLHAVRAAGALASALAGVAALLTDGAFEERPQPLGGWWKESPFAKYRVTPWGGTLLAVILIAPTVQFVGDWMKDNADAKSLQATAENIQRDIDKTVALSTEQSQRTITSTVRSESEQQLFAQRRLLDAQTTVREQTSKIAVGAEQILTAINKQLYPFKDITWAYEVRINLDHPKLQTYRQFLRKKADEIFKKNPLNGDAILKSPGDSVTGGTDYPSTDTFQRFGQPQRLLIHIDSPLMPDYKDPAFGAVLGYETYVDIFKNKPASDQLASSTFRSSDYAVTILSPYDSDTYGMRKAAGSFEPANYLQFELIYVPAPNNNPDGDELLLDYYWHAMKKFDVLARDAKPSISGLPDLADSQYVIRIFELRDFWGSVSPLHLEFLRMDVGDMELMFSTKDLGPPVDAGDFAIYQIALPKDFADLLKLFTTVRSDEDRRPLPTSELRLPTGKP
jgi:hypothetical protein